MVLGAVMLAVSLVMLYMTPSLAQYIAPVPETEQTAQDAGDDGEGEGEGSSGGESAEATGLARIDELWQKNRGELGDSAVSGLSATAYGFGFNSSASQSDTATLTMAGDGFFGVHPRYLTAGRLFSQSEYTDGAKLVVLDEGLAFKLFPTTEAVNGRVDINGEWYDVIGVVRHKKGAGDTDEYGAYITLAAAAKAGIQADYAQIECLADASGRARALQSISETVLGEAGTFYDTDKEIMRASMLVRVLLIIFGLYLLAAFLRTWNARTFGLIRGWQEEVMHRYFKAMLPKVIGLSLMQILGYCALAAAAFGVLRLTIRPMYVFTEWIPEVIVEWSKITDRVTGLMTTSAATVRYQTREYAAIRFYGAFVRWGVICIMTGGVIRAIWHKKKRAD